ncbi:MAG: exonuclease SbcCD subunit D [Selenomonadaceae bacterium]|nr:exonuclease SbcCD subunit D [Selenomonadaceae bacterium]
MKFLHTADWHLGKTLKGQPLIDDQNFILDEIFKIIGDEKPDAILIAGDIYDRNIPPVDAVELFNETLTKLAEKNLPTLIIAGNHDSATRLNFGSKIFERQNIYIAAKIEDEPKNVVLEDDFGEIYFSMIPYLEPADIKDNFFDEESARLTFNAANKFYVDLARQKIPAGKRSVALAHMFLTGGIESESERKFVGGAENVSSEIFSDYNYVALGHLHRSQKISADNVRYAGSPLKYSFDEEKHKKSVTLVDIDGAGNVETKKIPLIPRRDVRVVKGTFDELKNIPQTEDYICAKLTERVINVQDKLAWNFPHLLSVEFHLPQNFSEDDADIIFGEGSSVLDYFADFFKAQTGEDLNEDYREAMGDFFAEISKEE